MMNNEHVTNELDRRIAECLREAGGDPDRACAIADRHWDCGHQMMQEIYKMIRIAAAAAAVASPSSPRH
jgi:hypothetical protein